MGIEEGFKYDCEITEMQRLLTEVKKEAVRLQTLFLTGEEHKEIVDVLGCFNSRVQEMVYGTLRNLEGYLQYRWQELFNQGENADGRIDPIQENRQ